MSGLAILIAAIRSAVSALRYTATALEEAVDRAESLSGPAPSEVSDWDYIPSDPTAGSSPAASCGYNDVAKFITAVPQGALDLCSKLGGSEEDRRARAQRAWEAGKWARATIEGKVPTPRPSTKLPQKPTVYIILKAPNVRGPVRVATAAEYFKLIPSFDGNSVSHSFPSQAEARIYCIAAGFAYPAEFSEK
eukprot:s47_g39.t1